MVYFTMSPIRSGMERWPSDELEMYLAIGKARYWNPVYDDAHIRQPTTRVC